MVLINKLNFLNGITKYLTIVIITYNTFYFICLIKLLGLLFLVTKSEETSYWLLKMLVEKFLPDYYSKSMGGLLVDIEVLSELVKLKVPDVHEHINKIGMYFL